MSFIGKNIGRWKIEEKIGRGGNGQVYRAIFEEEIVAIKVLHESSRVDRFKDEVESMRRLTGVHGVLPVIDCFIPDSPTNKNPAWFAMPVATPLQNALGQDALPVTIVEAIKDLALVLIEIHNRGFSHRDIKPDNLFHYDSKWTVGDFGLVDFEGKTHETQVGERVGPIYFIAPEMFIEGSSNDGKAADVFSLAKTLWALLVGQRFPIPGPYRAADKIYQVSTYVDVQGATSLDCLGAANKQTKITTSRVNLQLRNEWKEVIDASRSEDLAINSNNQRNEALRAASDKFHANLRPLYEEMQDVFEAADLRDVVGPKSDNYTLGTLVSAWFPVKTTNQKRLRLEFGVWFNPDYEDINNNFAIATALGRMLIQDSSGGRHETIFEDREELLIDGPSIDNYLNKISSLVLPLLESWLEVSRKRWSDLG
jgi:serine/threonine protein kinase